jgi:peptidyl-tRNA hydrolase ICT1
MQGFVPIRPVLSTVYALAHLARSRGTLGWSRALNYRPYEAAFDQDELAEARGWHQSFELSSLPRGATTFARSSGPVVQHVNKSVARFFRLSASIIDENPRTETKATTTWPVGELMGVLPRILHPGIRSSRHYSRRNDSISFQAQTQRSRTANADENYQKLFLEIQRLYRETVPGESSPDKKQKYEAL